MSEISQQAVRIKLCGMTRPQDAALASALGADAIGMIFYPKSTRNVLLQTAGQIAAVVSPLCTMVAVVVNPTKKELDEILNAVPIHAIQFHGDESADFCASFGRPYIKAIRMQPGVCLSKQQAQYASASALLLDTHHEKLVGGTGQTFDWSMLDNTTTNLSQSGPGLILAGGLSPDNVEQALVQTGIYHLDVNSGIEVAPGVKDHDKMRAIMQIKTNHAL